MSLPVPVPGITVIETLAYGGFAVVYRARQESVGREVALKVDNRLAHDVRDRRRFLREAHAAGQLSDHPHVISIYDAGFTPDERPYLVMELCPGGSLAQRLRDGGPMSPAAVRDIGVKIADALQCAHDAGVLHRDVKPANVLINRFGSPGLADFGMAANFAGPQQVSATIEALTPAFAPPEVFRREVPTTAVNVYGLAATLYCLLLGRPPRWPAEGHPSMATIVGFQDEPIPDIPGIPAALNAVIRKSLSADAADRHPTAAALRDALAEVVLEAPTGEVGAVPAEPRRAVERRGAAAAEPSGRAERRPHRGRHLASVWVSGHTSVERAAPRVILQPSRRTGTVNRPAPRQPQAVEQPNPPRRLAFADSLRPRADSAAAAPPRVNRPRPGVGVRRSPWLVLAAAAAAVLGVVTAVATNDRSSAADRLPIAGVIGKSAGASVAAAPGTGRPPPTSAGAASSVPVSSGPVTVARPSAGAVKSVPPQPPRLRSADPNVISGLGLGPFRVGEPAQPLLAAGLARHPDSDDPCPAAAQLLSTDPRYRTQLQTLSAHTVNGKIVHVTVFSEANGTRSGLRVGSTLVEITAKAPQARQFGSLSPSYLVKDGANALLLVVRNAVVMAIVAGSEPELTGIAQELGRAPSDLGPLC